MDHGLTSLVQYLVPFSFLGEGVEGVLLSPVTPDKALFTWLQGGSFTGSALFSGSHTVGVCLGVQPSSPVFWGFSPGGVPLCPWWWG